MSDKAELQSEASATEGLSSTEGAMLERLVMRWRLAGTYSIVKIGKYFAVKKHGIFYDVLISLRIPHITISINGEPYFNMALGTEEECKIILRRFNGAKGYS